MYAEDYEKQNHEMMSNLASILSNNPENIKAMSYNRSRSPDGTENTELTVTMKDADVHQPLTENGDTGEIMVRIDALCSLHFIFPFGELLLSNKKN